MTTELIEVEVLNAVDVFGDGGVDSIIETIEEKTKDFKPDLSSATSRKEIAAISYKIARSKTALDAIGKELVSGWKIKSKAVDGERKRLRDTLDEMAAEIRKPLTEYEDDEKARTQKHKDNIFEIVQEGIASTEDWETTSVESMQSILAEIEATPIGEEHWDEFASDAAIAKDETIKSLKSSIAKREKYDADQAEIKRLQEEKDDLEREKREQQIASEAEQKGRTEANAKQEREATETRAREADVEHRRAINNEVLTALKRFITDDEVAKDLLRAMAKDKIPNVKINY